MEEVEKIISRDCIRTHNETRKTKKKIENLIEFDERMKLVKDFMETWNYWRQFYLDLPATKPKTKGQLTCIENILDLVKEENVNLRMLIAATHKAYSLYKRKYNPTYATVLHSGLDFYDKYYDDILIDIDKDYE